MTVSSSISSVSYSGNGATTGFSYTFKIFADSDLVVSLKNNTTGVSTTQTLTTDYTVSGAGSASGGNVTFVTAPPSGNTVIIRRVLPYTQETDYTENDPFPAASHEDALDKLTMLTQQNRDEDAIKLPEGDVTSGINNVVPNVVDRANTLLGFDATGNVIVEPFTSSSLNTTVTQQALTGNGSTTVFTLASNPGAAGVGVSIYIDGVYQERDTYSISDTTLTFTEAPPNNASIEVLNYRITDIGTADANNVTYSPNGSGAVQTTVQTKLRESVSVKDFGAVGDGVTDDTAAIQAALDVGGKVILPEGTYKVTSLTISDGSDPFLQGDGSENTKIQASQNVTALISFNTEGHTNFGYGGGLSGIEINMGSFTGRALDVVGWKAAVFDDLQIYANTGEAIRVTQADTTVADNREPAHNQFKRVLASTASGNCLLILARDVTNGAPQTVGLSFESCQFSSDDDDVVLFQLDSTSIATPAIQRISFTSCFAFIKANNKTAYYFDNNDSSGNIANITFIGCHAEASPATTPTGTIGLSFDAVASSVISGIFYNGELAVADRFTKSSTGIIRSIDISSNKNNLQRTFVEGIQIENPVNAPAKIIMQAGDSTEQDQLIEFRNRSGTKQYTFGYEANTHLEVRDDADVVRFRVLQAGAVYFFNSSGATQMAIFDNKNIEMEEDLTVKGDRVKFTNLPTSSAGLPSGALYNDSGTIKIV
jgi:hypothetical protein